MNQKTKKLIRLCRDTGYRFVAIGVNDPRNRRCRSWPFGYSDSVFCSPRRSINGWPAIWAILHMCGIGMSCGNCDQAQIGEHILKLTPGAYRISAPRQASIAKAQPADQETPHGK